MGRGLMQALTHFSQPVCCTSAEACSSYSRHLKKTFPVESNGEAVRLDGGVCYLPVSLMELDTNLLRVGVKSAMMSSETMTLSGDYTADMTHKPTGANRCMHGHTMFSFAPLIFFGVQDVYQQQASK